MTDGFTRSIIYEFHVDCKRFFGFSPFFRFAQKGREAPVYDSQKVYNLIAENYLFSRGEVAV